MRELERQVMLTVLDRKWREHLYEMDYLREGIGLRAMAQKDPLVEYQREGGEMYSQMMEAFKEEVVGYLYHLEVEVQRQPAVGVVPGSDGLPMQVGAGTGNGARQPLVESGPDPDGPGVEVTTVDPEDGHRPADGQRRARPEPEPEPETVGAAVGANGTRPQVRGKGLPQAGPRATSYSSSEGQVRTGAVKKSADDPYANVGRNSPCPCGSGKKFKMCHGRHA
jgi:preprotein translocase subunit SecA